jgi:predicted alpha/beta hydrolase family esterase
MTTRLRPDVLARFRKRSTPFLLLEAPAPVRSPFFAMSTHGRNAHRSPNPTHSTEKNERGSMSTALIIPGLHSSGPDHWQSWFESRLVPSRRVVQRDWRNPNLAEWSQRASREIHRAPGRIFIVAHSFGVLAAALAAHDHRERIAGAMLVAPADPDKFGVADLLPTKPLGFPSVVIASANDPWIAIDRAARWADLWGADLVNLGAAGHINAESGYGPWPEGLQIFARLRGLADQARTQAVPCVVPAGALRRQNVVTETRLEAAS